MISGTLRFIQHGTNVYTLTFSSFWKNSLGEQFTVDPLLPYLDYVNGEAVLDYTISDDGTYAIAQWVLPERVASIGDAILGIDNTLPVTSAGVRAAITALMSNPGGIFSADPANNKAARKSCATINLTTESGELTEELIEISCSSLPFSIQAWTVGINQGGWNQISCIVFNSHDAWAWSEVSPIPSRPYAAYEFNIPLGYTIGEIVDLLNTALSIYTDFTAAAVTGASGKILNRLSIFGKNNPYDPWVENETYTLKGNTGTLWTESTAEFDLNRGNVWHINTEDVGVIGTPLNAVGCQFGFIVIEQGDEPVSVTFSSFWEPAAGYATSLTLLPNAYDLLCYAVLPGGTGAVYSAIGQLPALVQTSYSWGAGQSGAYETLTSASASIAVDLAISNNFNHLLTEDATLAEPTHAIAGQSGVIHFTQDATTAMTLAFDTFWGFGVGVTPAMTETLEGTAVMSYIVDPAGTSATCSWVNKS